MRPVEGKDNDNTTNWSESASTSSQEKLTFKRKILNPFRRLSLKRTKSYGQRYNLVKSENDFHFPQDQHHDNHQNCKFSRDKIIEESRMKYSENNPFQSENNLPLPACTTQTFQSLQFFPNEQSDSPKNFDSTHLLDNKALDLIFNPADLPAVPNFGKYDQNNQQNYIGNAYETKSSQTQKNNPHNIKKSAVEFCSFVPSTFIPSFKNSLSTNFTIKFKEITDLINYLQENESHLKLLFSKYIRDENFQKELLEAISGHAKIQIENERRAYKLAQEMFSLEQETQKTKENVLRNSLEIVVQINRLLEQEIQNLKVENEKIVVDYDNESSSCEYHKKYEADILKNNNELRTRIKHLINEIRKLESSLNNLENENECLLNQLATANTQNRTYRDMLRKTMGDHEIEHSALLQQISNNEQVIKVSIDAGDTLMEDLESIKRQLKQMPFAINWAKFKCRGNSVVDLLHLARSCINELCRELMNTHMQISFRSKDSESQIMEISKLNQEINKFRESDAKIQSKIQEICALQIQLQVQEQKANLIKSELEMYKNENNNMTEKYYQEKNIVTNFKKTIEDLTTQISEKNLDLTKLDKKMSDIVIENSTLRCHIDSLKKLLEESQITRMVSELLETQEKCAYFQAQYHLVEIEKNNLIEQSEKCETERESFLKYQQTYNELIKLQNANIEELTRQNQELKAQLTLEEKNLNEKNEQLLQSIQESNIMKTVQSQFSSEITKNQALQSNALDTNFEMNRLTVVAEYNNLISQNLQNAMHSKDLIILELKTNLDILCASEKRNLEEKSALCRELVEASYMIKQLKNEVKNGNEKNKELANEKVREQQESDKKITELHKMLIEERQATHELLNDHKNLTTQRNNLAVQQKEHVEIIEKLKNNENINNNLKFQQEQLQNKCSRYEEQLQMLTKDLHESNKKIELSYQKAKCDTNEYENKLSSRDDIIDKLKIEKDELTNTIKYLQNNLQKLHSDLDALRKQEKEYKEKFSSNLEALTKVQQCSDNQQKILEQCSEEQKILEQNLNQALSCNNDLLKEYSVFVKESRAKEENLQNELKTYKNLNETKSKCIEDLARDSKSKVKLLEQKQLEHDSLRQQLQNYEETKQELIYKSKLLEKYSNDEQELRTQVLKLVSENKNFKKKMKEYSEIIKLLRTQLETTTKDKEKEIENCQDFIRNITSETQKQKDDMLKDLQNLTSKLNEINSKYREKCEMFDNLKTKFKNLSNLLVNTVAALEEERSIKSLKENEILLLKKELADLKVKLEYTSNFAKELSEIKNRTITEIGDTIQDELEETKKMYSSAKIECKTLESQLKETINKLNKLERFTEIESSHALKELEGKSELLQQYQKNLEMLEDRVKKLREQSKSANELISKLRSEICHLYQKVQMLEFQKCELTLKYYELNGKYLAEKNLNVTLKDGQESHLTAFCELTEHVVERKTSNTLMLIQK